METDRHALDHRRCPRRHRGAGGAQLHPPLAVLAMAAGRRRRRPGMAQVPASASEPLAAPPAAISAQRWRSGGSVMTSTSDAGKPTGLRARAILCQPQFWKAAWAAVAVGGTT